MDVITRPLELDVDKLSGLSARLLASHHENNYTGAVKRLNAIRKQLGALDWASTPVYTINGLKREELIAANSAFLHELYFASLSASRARTPVGLAAALERDFGSVDRWTAEFTALAKAMGGGSGWALTSWSSREARLVTHWAADHTHLLGGATPVVALDMYEHAYHLDYGAKAAAYVDAFMQNLDWEAVHRRYADAVARDAATMATDVATFKQSTGGARVIDVRRSATHAQAADTIPGATWRDPAHIDAWSADMDKSQPVVVFCVHGLEVGQSTALALRARGIDAHYLTGGIEAWREAGGPVEAKGTHS